MLRGIKSNHQSASTYPPYINSTLKKESTIIIRFFSQSKIQPERLVVFTLETKAKTPGYCIVEIVELLFIPIHMVLVAKRQAKKARESIDYMDRMVPEGYSGEQEAQVALGSIRAQALVSRSDSQC